MSFGHSHRLSSIPKSSHFNAEMNGKFDFSNKKTPEPVLQAQELVC